MSRRIPIGAVIEGGTSGSVLFVSNGALAEDNDAFFWDETLFNLDITRSTTTTTPTLELLQESTGDSAMRVTLAGGASYIHGIDNTDDSWKLCYGSAGDAVLGTNERISVTTGGIITLTPVTNTCDFRFSGVSVSGSNPYYAQFVNNVNQNALVGAINLSTGSGAYAGFEAATTLDYGKVIAILCVGSGYSNGSFPEILADEGAIVLGTDNSQMHIRCNAAQPIKFTTNHKTMLKLVEDGTNGQILSGDGTIANPAIAAISDPDTGLRWGAASNILDFIAGGARYMQFSSGGLFVDVVDSYSGNGVRLGAGGGKVAFYGTSPVSLQTGVAVTATGVHNALVNLGLITA